MRDILTLNLSRGKRGLMTQRTLDSDLPVAADEILGSETPGSGPLR